MGKSRLQYIIHFLGWVVLFSIPVFLKLNGPFPMLEEVWIRDLSNFFLIMLMFYLNYLVLIPNLLMKKRFGLYFVSIAGILLFVISSNMLLFELLNLDQVFLDSFNRINASGNSPFPVPSEQRGWGVSDRFLKKMTPVYNVVTLLPLMFVLLLGVAIRFSESWLENERISEEIKKDKLETELSFLKSQINPHFFFNMLNNIYSLIQTAPEKAQIATHKLSKLMRYVLYEAANDKVNVSTEVSFIENYLELARIRFPEVNQIRFNYDIENEETLIAPLLFIPFLENMFKHGISNNPTPKGEMNLNLNRNRLHFYSQNNFVPGSNSSGTDYGIGLSNVKRRLDLLYPDKHSLQINSSEGQFKVVLIIETI